ncbi:protein odr-4 homolog [Babylonia areolata]|uniref:protein odr-4 homolog n=1 Tax=Babylonia areolata TaxID=304850 RepID=UPI003FD50E5A
MGRSVYCDEISQAYIESLIKKGRWHIGLIVGQLSAQKDFVVLLARTPEAKDDEVCEVSEIGKEEELPSKRKTSKPFPSSLDSADDLWVATHAKQVTRMLPGGLDVIGIFVVAPSHILKDASAKLRQLLFAVHKSVTKNVPATSVDAVTDRIILQVDSLSSKIVCSSLDVANQKSTPRPAEWRYSSATRWLRLVSSVAVDVLVPGARNETLQKSMQQAIAPFCQDIMKSLTLVGGEVRESTELLATFSDRKKGKGKERDVSVKDTYHVDFFMPVQASLQIPQPAVKEVTKLMSVRGIITCRAFVHWKATVKEAVEAIKTDIVRSLCTRCELLSEDLELTDEGSAIEFRQLYDTPVRVFARANTSGAQICDYMFQDEKREEVVERIQELLDMTVTAESLETTCEHPARENDWVTASHSEHSLSTLAQDTVKPVATKSNFSTLFGIVVTVVVALVAAVMSYVFMEKS